MFILAAVFAVIILVLTLIIRTLLLSRKASGDIPRGINENRSPVPGIEEAVNWVHLEDGLREAVSIPSVTHADYAENDESQLQKFQDFLEARFAGFLSSCRVEKFGVYGIAICWPGSTTGKPLLYTAHYDVVPVEGQEWTCDPFGGEIRDDFIWGRGTLDTKNSLMAMMESAAALQANGIVPTQDIWFAFGGDEETESRYGARTMARWFGEQGIRFSWIFDEGGIIAKGMVPGISQGVALVGVEEKGIVNVKLTARGGGGHASAPGKQTAVGRLSRAIWRLENWKRKQRLPAVVVDFFAGSVPYQKFPLNLLLSNIWFFGPILKKVLSGSNATRAMIQSTISPTVIKGSSGENVLPEKATAIVNVRILPGESIESIINMFKARISDAAVEVAVSNRDEANDPVLAQTQGVDLFMQSVAQSLVADDSARCVLPYLMTASTDSKYYAPVSDGVFRFVPMLLDDEGLGLVHSPDERIHRENYHRMIRFYLRHIYFWANRPVDDASVGDTSVGDIPAGHAPGGDAPDASGSRAPGEITAGGKA